MSNQILGQYTINPGTVIRRTSIRKGVAHAEIFTVHSITRRLHYSLVRRDASDPGCAFWHDPKSDLTTTWEELK